MSVKSPSRTREPSTDGGLIVVERRHPAFFTIENAIIDRRLGLETVAIYAYLRRHGHATQAELMEHFGIASHHVYHAIAALNDNGFLTVDMSEIVLEER